MAKAPENKIIVVGGGLSGLMATLKICEGGGKVDLFSYCPVKRSHSLCAQGGINACMDTKGEHDSIYEHFDDTVYGGDFLADQLAVKGMVEAVNILGAEDYLLSVVSLLPEERRREESVAIRRSLMAQMVRRREGRKQVSGPELVNTPEVITWLEHRPREERPSQEGPVHAHYDVCASEHCHRYEGLTPAADAGARAVIDETWGQTE